jgi:hypothetical protein
MKPWFATKDGYIFSYLVKGSKTKRRTIAGQRSATDNGQGYLSVMFRPHRFLVHRLVWEYFNGPIPKGLTVNHINGIKTDNRLENLEVVTQAENNLHYQRLRKGLPFSRNNQDGLKSP